MISLTPRAADELGKILSRRAESTVCGLRLAIRRGGCAGWQYEMQVADPAPDDVVVESQGTRVIIAGDSVDRLRGCEIDYIDDLSDSGFRVNNPRATRSCGCGTSFEEEGDEPTGVADGEACDS